MVNQTIREKILPIRRSSKYPTPDKGVTERTTGKSELGVIIE